MLKSSLVSGKCLRKPGEQAYIVLAGQTLHNVTAQIFVEKGVQQQGFQGDVERLTAYFQWQSFSFPTISRHLA